MRFRSISSQPAPKRCDEAPHGRHFRLVGSNPRENEETKSPHVRAGCACNGADDGVRTRDPDLGKVVLYQLSHVRVVGGTRFELVTPTVSR